MQTFSLRLTQFFVAVAIVILCIAAVSEASADDKSGSFVDSKSGQPLKINPAMFDSEQAKKFMSSGRNPYIGDK